MGVCKNQMSNTAWNVIRSKTNNTVNIQENVIASDSFRLLYQCQLQTSNNKITDGFGPAVKLLKNYVPVRYDRTNYNIFKWKRIQVNDVQSCVSKLSSSKSEDYYGLSNKVEKEIINTIAEPITYGLNIALQNGTFTEALKLTKTEPAYKKGDKPCPSSYRLYIFSSYIQ